MSDENESMQDWVRRAITERGLENVVKGVSDNFCKMCRGTRLKKELGAVVIAFGYDHLDPDKLEEGIVCLVAELPAGEVRTWLETDLAFWRKNRQEIMADHDVTPA